MEHPITTYRRKHSLTQDAFGRLVDATKGMVSKWEACRILPRPQFIEKIEDVTAAEVTASDLVRSFNELNSKLEAAE
ncbi:helix-turn-helix domain-containing protein [Agrobacterium sp. Azo12]|jgi:transcriptional regulator with XRE-family HTH domain|uniref:helix-turn-helix domain-containing protein n=1 Tax=Agrobacterium sp. Azo12 TaxID=3031129 RepID=UPI0023D7F64F|nr:helix-turn-helix transcriptional regulator [Agrobacterium sp. Azo12]MDO5895100.1 helix-turn-helix transcriptional regulator [Agrobacterium sp. Azo12]